MIIRFSAFHQALTSGQFPVRFVDRLNNNYGYPVMNFLYPLPFYLSEFPKLISLDFTWSVKSVFILSTIASSLAMYWCLSKRFSAVASLTGAVVYLYIPYRFVDLYVRGSIGESLAFVFPPLCFLAVYQIKNGKKIYLPILSFFMALLILSHNIIAILFIPLIIFESFLLLKGKSKEAFLSIGLGFLLSSFFWLPAILDLKYVKFSQIKISEVSNHLVAPLKVFVPSWDYGPNPNSKDGLSVQFGVVSLFVFLATIVSITFSKKRDILIVTFLAIYASIFFLMTKTSEPLWSLVPFIDIIQFPWRLLSVIVFISAFFAAFTVNWARNKTLTASLVILASIVSTFPYTFPKSFENYPDGYYSTNEDTTTVRDEYMPLWVTEKPLQRASSRIESSPEAKIENVKGKGTNYRAQITASSDTTVTVNTIYFPGWQVIANGSKTAIDYSNPSGLITFKLPKGLYNVKINYGKTRVHLLAELISLTGLLITGYRFFFYLKRR